MRASARHVAFVAGVLFIPPACASAQTTVPRPDQLRSFAGNVVRIDASGRTGFGFVVALRTRELLVATAWHTLQDLTINEVDVCSTPAGNSCARGSIVYVADAIGAHPALDLAIVAAPYPPGVTWRPDVFTAAELGEPVWFIGRSGQWYIPPEAGRLTGADSMTQSLSYNGLDVAKGVSGAPIVSARGIVAMHVESSGDEDDAHGIDIRAIRDRVVNQTRAQWILVPPATCDDQDAHRRVLDGRNIMVHFDGERPAAGLDAMARLNCLGAHALPRPLWTGDEWASAGVVAYASGDVRAARAIQAVLARIARLDTQLADAPGELAVWIR